MGVQLDAAYQLGNGFNIGGTLLWQDTEYEDGSVVSDGRRASPAGGALLVDLGGNELPRTPPLTLNLRLGQDIELSTGTLDWIASATYKSSYFLTGFNGGSGEDGGREVTSVDADGVANGFGARPAASARRGRQLRPPRPRRRLHARRRHRCASRRSATT